MNVLTDYLLKALIVHWGPAYLRKQYNLVIRQTGLQMPGMPWNSGVSPLPGRWGSFPQRAPLLAGAARTLWLPVVLGPRVNWPERSFPKSLSWFHSLLFVVVVVVSSLDDVSGRLMCGKSTSNFPEFPRDMCVMRDYTRSGRRKGSEEKAH